MDKMDIVFKAFHYYSKDGLHRFPEVTKKLTAILVVKFPTYEEKILQNFSKSRTIFRMRNMQRHQYSFQFLSFLGQKLYRYSHLSNNRGGWNKRGGEAKIAKSLNVEAGINVEVGKYL